MLFVNISSDQVHILDDQDEHFLERNGIENTLWPIVLEYTQNHPVETLLLLNGPGGFTNLRVGTLTINMLNTLLEHDTWTFIPIASITKIDFYSYAYNQGRLPRYGILYIGQKHNVWRYDFQEHVHKQITLEEIIERHNESLKGTDSFHDVEIIPTTSDASISNEVQKLKISEADRWKYSDDLFLDFVRDPYWPTTEAMIYFSMANNTLHLQYKNNAHAIELRNLRIPLTMTVQPEYFIQPTMN